MRCLQLRPSHVNHVHGEAIESYVKLLAREDRVDQRVELQRVILAELYHKHSAVVWRSLFIFSFEMGSRLSAAHRVDHVLEATVLSVGAGRDHNLFDPQLGEAYCFHDCTIEL